MESAQRPTAILAIDTPGHFAVQLDLAKEFALQGFTVIALVNAPAEIQFLHYVTGRRIESGRLGSRNLGHKLYDRIKSRLRGSRFVSLKTSWQLFELPLGGNQNQKFATKRLPFSATWRSLSRSNKVKILVWPEFNFFYGHLVVYRLAKNAGVFQAIYTYSLVNEKEWLLSLSKDFRRTKHSLANMFIDRFFSGWTRLGHGFRIRLPLSFPLLSKLVGYTTYNPWLSGANKTVPIFTPDSFTFKYLLDSGYDSSHIHVGGMPRGANLLELRSSYLAARRTESSKRPSVVVALPPDQTSDSTGFAYQSLLNKTIFETATELLNLADFAFVFHPRISETSKSALIQKGIVVLEDVAKAVAECDIYVACSSATLRIAEALGVPAIDYDLYALGYKDFEAAQVVRAANDASNFRNVMLALLTHPPFGYEMDQKIAGNPVQAIIQMSLENLSQQSSKANGLI